MPINPLISMGVQPMQMQLPDPNSGMNALARVMQMKSLENQDAAAKYNLLKVKRDDEREVGLNDMYRNAVRPDGTIDDTALITGAAQRGYGSAIPGIQKQLNDQARAKADRLHAEYGTPEKVMEAFRNNIPSDPMVARGWLKAQYDHPVLGRVAASLMPFDAAVQSIPTDPAQFEQWRKQAALGMTKFIEKNAPNYQQVDSGGRKDILAIPGLGGAPTTVASVQKTMTPGELAADRRAGANLDMRRQEFNLAQSREKREAGADATSGAAILGVPTPTVLPWANQSNPKDANKVKATEISRGAKEIEKDVDAAAKAQSVARDAKRFMELNAKIPTGGLMDRMALTRWAQSMGNEYAELEAITARLVPGMREPGTGASSDLDVKMFERGTVGVDKPKKANENIAKAIQAKAQQAQEYADFRQTYLEQNGTLQGADRHWKEYVNANPIFQPESKDFDLNPKRKAWTEHFKGKTGKAAADTAASGGGLTPAEQKELAELRARLKQ